MIVISTFKDMVAADIDNIFFNVDELADFYTVDGCEIAVVQDDNRILDKTDMSALGTALGEGIIFVKAKDMPRIPLPGDRIKINEKQWYIRDAKDNTGVYEIHIGYNQQYL